MKRKILSGIVILAITMIVAFNVNLGKINQLPNIGLANTEALAECEEYIIYDYPRIHVGVCNTDSEPVPKFFGVYCTLYAPDIFCEFSN